MRSDDPVHRLVASAAARETAHRSVGRESDLVAEAQGSSSREPGLPHWTPPPGTRTQPTEQEYCNFVPLPVKHRGLPGFSHESTRKHTKRTTK